MGLQVYGLLLRGRPQVRLLSGTCCKYAKDFSFNGKVLRVLFYPPCAVFHF